VPHSLPPVPILAQYPLPGGAVTVTFDQPLRPDPALETTNWFIRHNGLSLLVLTAYVLADRVVLSHGFASGNPGPNVVSFNPPPFDVQGAAPPHDPTAAFSDFPLT